MSSKTVAFRLEESLSPSTSGLHNLRQTSARLIANDSLASCMSQRGALERPRHARTATDSQPNVRRLAKNEDRDRARTTIRKMKY